MVPGEEEGTIRAIVTTYIHMIVFTEHSREKMGLRNSRELISLGLIADLLLKGQVAKSLAVVIQRIKAIERSILDNTWQTARWYELIPTGESHLTSRSEAKTAARYEKAEQDLKRRAPHKE